MLAGSLVTGDVALAASPRLVDLTVTDQVTGGSSVGLKVTLAENAPKGGTTVKLASSHSALTTPASVTVPAGARTASTTATTKVVTSRTKAVVSATYGSATKTETVVISPNAQLKGLVAPATIANGESATVTVSLTAKAPAGGTTVRLVGNRPSVLTVPATVTIPAGSTTGAATVTAATHRGDATVALTAKLAGSANVATSTTVLGTGYPEPQPISVTFSVLENDGQAATVNVCLVNGTATATEVTLDSTSEFIVSVLPTIDVTITPSTLSLSAGAPCAEVTVAVTTEWDAAVTLRATVGGQQFSAEAMRFTPAPPTMSITMAIESSTGQQGAVTVCLLFPQLSPIDVTLGYTADREEMVFLSAPSIALSSDTPCQLVTLLLTPTAETAVSLVATLEGVDYTSDPIIFTPLPKPMSITFSEDPVSDGAAAVQVCLVNPLDTDTEVTLAYATTGPEVVQTSQPSLFLSTSLTCGAVSVSVTPTVDTTVNLLATVGGVQYASAGIFFPAPVLPNELTLSAPMGDGHVFSVDVCLVNPTATPVTVTISSTATPDMWVDVFTSSMVLSSASPCGLAQFHADAFDVPWTVSTIATLDGVPYTSQPMTFWLGGF
jgi:hypothetical protein